MARQWRSLSICCRVFLSMPNRLSNPSRLGWLAYCLRGCLAVALAALMACAQSSTTAAGDMAEVHKALAEDRLFDAFRELLDLAKEGNPEAQYELAGFYHYGRVGAANFPKARDWYQRAANQGNVDAMIGLAVMNGKGLGAPADKKTADKWLIIAGNSQKLSPDAAAKVASARADLEQDLTPAEITAATAEAQSFVPKPEH